MGDAIETMRTALARYQRINVERIIVEEWKTRSLMTHGDDLIGIVDGGGEFIFRNTGLERFWADLHSGYSLRTLAELREDRYVTVLSESRREERSGQDLVRFIQQEWRVQSASRPDLFFRLKIVELERHGESIGSLVILHDLTDDRKVDQMRNDMINVIVHEMRNPAGGIRGLAEMLVTEKRMSEEDKLRFAELIHDGAERLLSLINRFLDIQRLEARGVDHPKEIVDLVALVNAVVLSQTPHLMERQLTAEVRHGEVPPKVNAAKELIRDGVQNLLSNAIKYGDKGRTIEIDVRSDAGGAVITVTDHGYGIPPAEQEKLFTKFFRVRTHAASSKEVGTGLGLAYVKEIMNYHGGSVGFESDPAYGSRFSLHFPADSDR
jgi:signal transduction histidine kinase